MPPISFPSSSDGTVIPGNLNLSAPPERSASNAGSILTTRRSKSILDERAARGAASIAALDSFHDGQSCREPSGPGRSRSQAMRIGPVQPGAAGDRYSAPVERYRGGRQSTVFDGAGHRLQHPLPCAAAELALSASRVSTGRSAGRARLNSAGRSVSRARWPRRFRLRQVQKADR